MNLRTALKNIFIASVTGLAVSVSAQTLSSYQAEVMSQNPANYFKLDGSLVSAINGGVVLESFAGGYRPDVFRNDVHETNSWYFTDQNTAFLRNLTDSLINGGGAANVNASAKGSISFLFRSLSGPNIGGQRALFDATTTASMGTMNHNAFALYFENGTDPVDPFGLKFRFGDATTTILDATNVLFSTWYHFVVTYDEARVPNKAIWYLTPLGGTTTSGMTANSPQSVAGEGTGLIIGNRAGLAGAFRGPGSGRIDEFAIWARELSWLEISNQIAKLPVPTLTGTYGQVVGATFPKYHFKLNNSLVDSVGGTLVLSNNSTGGAFTNDYLSNPNWAYSFSVTNDALVITNDLINGGGPGLNPAANGIGTISLLFRMLDGPNNGQKFIFSAPGEEAVSTDDNRLALFLEGPSSSSHPNSLKIMAGQHTLGNSSSTVTNTIPVEYGANLVTNAWYYFAMVYDEGRTGSAFPEVYYYFGRVGGTLKIGEVNIGNDTVIGNNGWLVIGNMVSNNIISGDSAFRFPGKGGVDEFTIWHEELSTPEIQAQFAALTPQPSLNISAAGSDVILTWPSISYAYLLESTNVLDSTTIGAVSWPGAGSPTVVGTNNVVTNTISSGNSFYRLRKP